MLGYDAAIRCASHGRQHGSETRVPAKYLQHKESLVRTSYRPQAVRHLDGPGNAGAETNTVICSRDIIVHCLGNADDLDPLFVKMDCIAERVITANRDHIVDPEPFQVLDHLRGQVIDLFRVGIS